MASTTAVLRKCLTASGLNRVIRMRFDKIEDLRQHNSVGFSLSDKLIVSIDGTGLFSSTKISCPRSGVKKRSSGIDEYYHQLLVGAIVSPHQTTVL